MKPCKKKDPNYLKAAGNKLFVAGRYEAAAQAYSQALDTLVKQNKAAAAAADDHKYLSAVLLSNRSNCHFEQGRYAESLEDSKSSISLLVDSKGEKEEQSAAHLLDKNRLRIARAHFYQEEFSQCQENLQDLIQNSSDAAYCQRAQRMHKQVAAFYYDKNNNRVTGGSPMSSMSPPPLLRATLMSPICEYFRFGHDEAFSALGSFAANQPQDDMEGGSNHDNDHILSMNETPKLSLLMAGINDGRHVFTTTMHLLQQYEGLDEEKKKEVQVDIVCNDINVSCIARFVLFLIILYRIGEEAPESLKDVNTTQKKNRAGERHCTLLQYLLLGYAMPPSVNELLIQSLEKVLALEGSADWEQAYPGLTCSDDISLTRVRQVWSYWLHQAKRQQEQQQGKSDPKNKKNSPPYPSDWRDIPSTERSIGHFFENETTFSSFDDMEKKQHNFSGVSSMAVLRERREEARARKESTIECMRDISNWPTGQKERMMERMGESYTDELAVKLWTKNLRDLPDEEFDLRFAEINNQLLIPGVALAKEFMEHTNALLPPREECKDDSIFVQIYDKDDRVGKRAGSKHLDKLFRKATKVVHTTFATNPLMYDPMTHSAAFGSPNKFQPVTEFITDFTSFEFCKEPIDVSNVKLGLTGKDAPSVTEFADLTRCFFWNSAHALVVLCKEKRVLGLEWNVGDVVSFCRTLCQQKQRQFHRILASNIPDYTGLLSFFTCIVPLLHESTDNFTSELRINILMNCPLWKNYEQYVYSSTGIQGLDSVERFLGAKFLGHPTIDSWSSYSWTRLKGSKGKAGKREFTLWLQRLFLIVAFPPSRTDPAFNREDCPSTMALFVEVCLLCIENLQYPIHWVSCALDELASLTNEKLLKTKACIPSKSPSAYQQENGLNKINVSAILLDLRTSLALVLQKRRAQNDFLVVTNKNILALEGCRFMVAPVKQYEATFPDISVFGIPRQGNPAVECLGLVLEATKPEEDNSHDDPLAFMAQMMGSLFGRDSIRDDIISKGSKGFHLLSCVEWQVVDLGKSNKVRFHMSDETYHDLRYHYVSVIRTDRWYRVGKAVPLSKVKAVAAN